MQEGPHEKRCPHNSGRWGAHPTHKSQFAACLTSLLLSLQHTVSLQSYQDTVCVSVWTPEHRHKIKQNSIMAGCKVMILQEYCQLTGSSFDVVGLELTAATISSVPPETSCEWVNDRHKVKIILTWTNSFSFHKHCVATPAMSMAEMLVDSQQRRRKTGVMSLSYRIWRTKTISNVLKVTNTASDCDGAKHNLPFPRLAHFLSTLGQIVLHRVPEIVQRKFTVVQSLVWQRYHLVVIEKAIQE